MTDTGTTNALSFLKKHSVGVLATLSPDSTPHARTVYYAADDSYNVFFFTLTSTRKVKDIAHDAHAAFVVSDENAPQTIQIEGTISDLTETATIDDVIRRLSDTSMKHGTHFAPLTHLDPGKIVFYKLTPTWVRIGDFTDGVSSDASFTEISL